MVLLFADVGGRHESIHDGEDEDCYRFIHSASRNIGAELVILNQGRNIWEVFRDDRFLGNARLANCSKFLKQRPARKWLEDNTVAENTNVYVGIDWQELHRLPAIKNAYLPWKAFAPLTDPPYLDKDDMLKWCTDEKLAPPRMYAQGYPHANCGGGCVRAGQGQFKLLYENDPERYAYWEAQEHALRKHLNKDVAILRERNIEAINAYCDAKGLPRLVPKEFVTEYETNDEGDDVPIAWETQMVPPVTSVPLTLKSFRERVEEKSAAVDEFDIGGCGCFTDETRP